MPVQVGPCKSKHPRSIDGFCDRNGICRATFYNLRKRGLAPRIMKLGARTTISEEAESDWRRQMEQAAGQQDAA